LTEFSEILHEKAEQPGGGSHTLTLNFETSRWRTAAILKITISRRKITQFWLNLARLLPPGTHFLEQYSKARQ